MDMAGDIPLGEQLGLVPENYAGFTLCTYTHQKQEQAVEKMGNFMNQVR